MVKRIVYSVLFAALLSSCEVIGEADRLIPVTPDVPENASTHLLIDYTGFRCVNCPTAAETAQALQQTYGERLIVVAMHPATNHFTQTKNPQYDYTCPEADSCYLFMGGTETTPFPTGNIDLTATPDGYFLSPNEWAAYLHARMDDQPAPHLQLEVSTDTVSRRIEITSYTYADTTLQCRLALWLVEDSVPGAQMMPDGSTNMNYRHRHMLRAAADGTPWGQPIEVGPVVTVQQTQMTVPEKCNMAKCAVTALLLDGKDRHVLQANQIEIQ